MNGWWSHSLQNNEEKLTANVMIFLYEVFVVVRLLACYINTYTIHIIQNTFILGPRTTKNHLVQTLMKEGEKKSHPGGQDQEEWWHTSVPASEKGSSDLFRHVS